MLLFLSADFFLKINIFKKLFQEHYQSVRQFGSKSRLTFCRSWSRSKLFAKAISTHQKSPLGRKELTVVKYYRNENHFCIFYWCANFGKSLTNWGCYVKFLSVLMGVYTFIKSTKRNFIPYNFNFCLNLMRQLDIKALLCLIVNVMKEELLWRERSELCLDFKTDLKTRCSEGMCTYLKGYMGYLN